ncbi:MAG: dihydroorotate dehydrogenase [Deltaproteobacteria bacterium]|nr:dihydroorotate dehydrogenase [Deltaproteobacteria bacterium]
MNELKVDISTLRLKNPIMSASGTFGFGYEFMEYYDTSVLGAIVCKGISKEPRRGNYGNRIAEIDGGIINSIGLENPGISEFLEKILPMIKTINTAYIVNILGSDLDEYLYLAEKLSELPRVDAIEVNISCPNVKAGGLSFGKDINLIKDLTRRLRDIFPKPIIIKVSPDLPYIEIAKICRNEGIDAITCINTIQSLLIDVEKKTFFFNNLYGGLSGPAIKPIALRVVYQVAKEVGIPVIGCGGIMSYKDAVEFFMAGATAVQIGTANFTNPLSAYEILKDLMSYLEKNKIHSVSELRIW